MTSRVPGAGAGRGPSASCRLDGAGGSLWGPAPRPLGVPHDTHADPASGP